MPKSRARLPANTYWRGSTIWGRVQIKGREHRESLRTSDPREARIKLEEFRARLLAEIASVGGGETFEDAVLRWEREVLPESVKPQVRRRYISSIAMLAPMFQGKKLGQITSRLIADYISSRSGQVTNATLRRDLTALSRLLSACCAWGWIESNPAKLFDRSIIRERKKLFQPPSPEEMAVLLAEAPRGMAQILELLNETGMRLNEAVTLERRDVDQAAQHITLVRTKTDRPRTIPFRSPGGDATRVLAAAVPHLKSPVLFRTRDDESYSQMSTNFLAVMGRVIFKEAQAGREYRRWRIHDLRHGFAIRWLREGGGIYELSRHLGHTSVKTTEVYLDYLTVDQRDVSIKREQYQHNRPLLGVRDA